MKRCFVILFSVLLIMATSNTVDAQKKTIQRDNQKTEHKSKSKPSQASKSKTTSTLKGKNNGKSKTYIRISCNASEGSLYIDGDYFGKPNGLHEVSNGSHNVKIVAQGYHNYESQIYVSPSSTYFTCQLNRDFNYKENEYLVTFTCNAVNASLSIDGKYIGNATGNYKITKGSHAVQIRCPGYIDHTSVLEVTTSRSIHYDLLQSSSSTGLSSSITSGSSLSSVIQKAINDMVYIEGGTFKMGATNEQGKNIFNDEKPVHKVTISSFYMSKYEVTQELWVEVMGTNPSHYVGDLNRPVDRVSWDDCQQFIRKLNQMTGKQFRLPTEAEWEYAARGGNRSQNYMFSGSNSIDNVAWHGNNSGFSTHPVGKKSSNELGLYDMSGNVTEWCQDWYGGTYYKNSTSNNPAGPPSGTNRISRGGCWSHSVGNCRISRRLNYQSSVKTEYQGLRLAASSL